MIFPSLDPTSPYRKAAIVLAVVLACLGCYVFGRHDGAAKATALGEAKYAKLEKAQADALAEANAKALARYVKETRRADEITAELLTARQRLAATRTQISKEIPHATAGLDACSFGPDFLRVYAQALGYGAPALPEAAGSGGAAPDHAAAPATDGELR